MHTLETLAPLTAYGVLGLLELLAGYRVFRLLVVALGGLAGLLFGPQLLAIVLGETPEPLLTLIAAIAGAVLFALLARLAVLVAAVAWVGVMAYAFAAVYLDDPFLLLLTVLAAALLAIFLERVVVIVVTSLHGAWLTVAATAAILGDGVVPTPLPRPGEALLLLDTPFLLGAALLLALAGMLIQSSTPPRPRRSRRR